MDSANTNPTLSAFRNSNVGPNTVNVPYILLSFKRYNFTDPQTDKNVIVEDL